MNSPQQGKPISSGSTSFLLISLFQLPADEAQAARLVRHAIEVGDPEAGYSPLPTGALA
jgi:hypothetical protein